MPGKEQNPLMRLLGFQESPDEKAAREAREGQEARSRAAIQNAVDKGALPRNVTQKPPAPAPAKK